MRSVSLQFSIYDGTSEVYAVYTNVLFSLAPCSFTHPDYATGHFPATGALLKGQYLFMVRGLMFTGVFENVAPDQTTLRKVPICSKVGHYS